MDCAACGSELEAVARAAGGAEDLRTARDVVEDEITVRRHRVETGFRSQQRSVRGRDVIRNERADQSFVRGRHRAVVSIGIDGLVVMVMLGDFDSVIAERRKAVVHAMRTFDQEYWEESRREMPRFERGEPGH